MEDSIGFFVPLLCCLCAGFGFICVAVSALGSRISGRAAARAVATGVTPPILGGLKTDGKRRGKGSAFWWKGLGVAGVSCALLGLAGLWATGFSLGLSGGSPREWSDGHASQLEALVRKRCARFVERGRTVGLAVAVVKSTNSTVMAFGRQSLYGKPVDGDTLFELGSITKTFTALAMAREIDRGSWTLDTPIQELLPPDVKLPENARGITLKNLTTHTSGFPRLPGNMSPWGSLKMVLWGADPYEGYRENDLLAGVQTVKLDSKPGTESSYSNFGLMLLGYLLGRKEGTNCETVIRGQICQPLGMEDTRMKLEDEQRRRAAQPYRSLVKLGPVLLALRSAPWFDSGELGGAGALRSSAKDMLKYLQANMHPTGPLEAAIRNSHKELFRESERIAYGMNWVLTLSQPLKQTMIWHNGATGGFSAFLGFTEDGRIGVVILSNSTQSVDSLGVALLHDLNRK